MRTEIKALHSQLGAIIIHVPHDQTEALSLADRIAVIKGGILQQFGTNDSPPGAHRRGVLLASMLDGEDLSSQIRLLPEKLAQLSPQDVIWLNRFRKPISVLQDIMRRMCELPPP